jgi:ABC-type lipoprotein export system ATPase subunit
MMALLRALGADGITIVLVTHEPNIAACAERVVVFKDGLICTDSAGLPALPAAATTTRPALAAPRGRREGDGA